MLYADKRALETNLKVNLLAIREKELNYYTQNCQAVGTQAALLAGFAYSGLTQVAIPHDRAYALRIAYLLVTTTAMCFELIAVLNTTLLSMMGPGLALRGPDGSMHPAVDGMMTEYRTAYYCFVLGLVFFHFSAALFSWLIYVHWSVSTMVTLCICGSLLLLTRYAKRVYLRFRLPAEMAPSRRATWPPPPGPSSSGATPRAGTCRASRRSSLRAAISDSRGGGRGRRDRYSAAHVQYVCLSCAARGPRFSRAPPLSCRSLPTVCVLRVGLSGSSPRTSAGRGATEMREDTTLYSCVRSCVCRHAVFCYGRTR
ncbi:hypothetical protein EMIHUDRAFT_436817 [Emiliania huxleyi CCMP1516]|uniref:Uncharacterized protein n=2 Tax=Emiliania huxleyi TaxID=2903 RepID=A0A0D3IVV2_EMIH1|nr:hypothetical protein EMIHUDRAFT_436817 [Emiliania huxleyi CCMP1516]EOD15387.1 hypothetical protein EMIHUDRAFT_436817 [Emiliania huxleyi CCMP1516]|eukprot:XP_005767816.1 hypothetical protein EMIHUDRAFT_436817 [Emiliania huxleyi CCMP1516]